MDLATRAKLQEIALQGLEATANDEEPWSFLFRTEGAVGGLFYPFSGVDDDLFDGEAGEDAPSEEELRQWQKEKAEQQVGSEASSAIWIVPLQVGGTVAGYA